MDALESKRSENRNAEPSRKDLLAMTGLAALLSSPALMHGFKGHLHNLALATELLQKEAAGPGDAAALRAIVDKRVRMLRSELSAMDRHLSIVEAISGGADEHAQEGVCDVRAGLNDVLPSARVEAARRHISLRIELEPAVERVECAPLAFQQLMLACSTQAIRHCAKNASLVIAAKRDGAHTRIEFVCDTPFECDDHATDRELLGLLARLSGAQFTGQPDMGVTFKSAS